MAVTVPKATQPGSDEWVASTVKLARSWSERSERDVRQLVGYVSDLREHGQSAVSEHGNWEAFCQSVIGYEADYLATMERGVGILEQRGHRGPVSEEQARRAAARARELGPIPKNGEAGNGRRSNVVRPTYHGNAADYLSRRLLRDAPEVFEKLEAGEFKSVRAAAIAAGIIKNATPLDRLKTAWRAANERQRQSFLTWIEQPTD